MLPTKTIPGRPTRPLPPAERWLARHVWLDGRDCGLSTVRMNDGRPVVESFAGETPGTVFVDGDIITDNNHLILI